MMKILKLPRDINRFCRTCMLVTKDGKSSFENHITSGKQQTDLGKILNEVTGLKPNNIDNHLPTTMCSTCTERLLAAQLFITKSKEVEASLLNLLALSGANCTDLDDELNAKQKQYEEFDISANKSKQQQDILKSNQSECYDENISQQLLPNYSEEATFEIDILEPLKRRKQLFKKIQSKLETSTVTEIQLTELATTENPETLSSDHQLIEMIPINAIKEEIDNVDVSVECKLCQETFDSIDEINLHPCSFITKLTTAVPEYACSLCLKSFNDRVGLSLHLLNHAISSANIADICNDAEFYFCEICGETFNLDVMLGAHYTAQHEGIPAWSCEFCFAQCDKEYELMHHDNLHFEQPNCKEPVCAICNSIFESGEDLSNHLVEHLMKKYNCRKCNSTFCTQVAYQQHAQVHYNIQYMCSLCNKVLGCKSSLKTHMSSVHSDREHKCTVCGKGFATAIRLRMHSKIHDVTKNFICSYCGYRAHKKADLLTHIRTHTSERPFKCTFAKCTGAFKTSSHLCNHLRRHLQVRKHKCNICLGHFSTGHSLKVHKMLHTGEKPHACQICLKKFRRRYHLKLHLQQHEKRPLLM